MGDQVNIDFENCQLKLSEDPKELLKAVENCSLRKVQNLVAHQRNSIKHHILFKYVLLVTALRRKHKSITKFLIKEYYPVRVSEKIGYFCTPLYYAVKMKDKEIFRALWEKGASIFEKDANDETALELAMTQNELSMINTVLDDITLAKILTDLKPDCEDHIALFHSACWAGNLDAVKMFLSRKFSPRSRSVFNQHDWKGFTPLHFTLHRPCYNEIFPHLLKRAGFDPLATDDEGRTPLHLALRNKHHSLLDEVKINHFVIPNRGQIINVVDKSGLSLLHALCCINYSNEADSTRYTIFLKNFIDGGRIDVNSRVPPDDADFPGYTALLFATERSCWSILEILLENGADHGIADKDGNTPLHLACKDNSISPELRLKLIKQLLHHGADPTAKNLENRTPLHEAFCSHTGVRALDESEKLLLSRNEESVNHIDKWGISYLHIACTGDDLGIVKALVKNGAQINSCIQIDSPRYAGYSALHFAVTLGRFDIVEFLLAHGADANVRIAKTKTMTKNAPKWTLNGDLVTLALEKGADHGIAEQNGITPLHIACKDNTISPELRLKLIKQLLHHGADPTAKNLENRTPLHEAFCSHTGVRALDESEKLLLSKNEQGINHTDKWGISYLHIACTGDDLGTVDILVKNGALINSCFQADLPLYGGYSALHFAVRFGRLEIVEFLLAHGADTNVCTAKTKTTPLHLACSEACSHNSEQLTSSNDGRDAERGDTEWNRSQNDHIRIVELLVLHGACVDVVDSAGNTPLLQNFSIWHSLVVGDSSNERKLSKSLLDELFIRQKRAMDILLTHGANINARYSNGYSILHVLCKNYHTCPRNLDLIKIVLERGADVNAADEERGFTPLHIVVENVIETNVLDLSLINLLLEYGANINAKTKDLETLLHQIIRSGQYPCQYHDPPEVLENIFTSLLSHPEIDVNVMNIWGETPLHLAIARMSRYFTEKLLDFGADINTDASHHSPVHILFNFFRELCHPSPLILKDKEVLTIVVTHIKKLSKLKIFVNEKVMEDFEGLLRYVPHGDLAWRDSKMDEEVERMKSRNLDNYTTLYDIMFKEPNALAKHALNDDLRAVISSIISKSDFLYLGSLIKRQYDRGCQRLSILEPAKCALNYVSNLNWPDWCSEKILSFLSDENLKNLIKSAPIEHSRKRSANDALLLENYRTKVLKVNGDR